MRDNFKKCPYIELHRIRILLMNYATTSIQIMKLSEFVHKLEVFPLSERYDTKPYFFQEDKWVYILPLASFSQDLQMEQMAKSVPILVEMRDLPLKTVNLQEKQLTCKREQLNCRRHPLECKKKPFHFIKDRLECMKNP